MNLQRIDAVGVIRLNRPAARNAINGSVSAAVGEALNELDADPGIRAAVITGNGHVFSAGADLKAIGAGESIFAPGNEAWGFAGLVEHPFGKPLIAAVNGHALGGGMEIVLACDLAVVSAEAKLGLPEVSRGLFAGAGGLINLPRQVPVKWAMEMALTGEMISAAQALDWGIVNRVVDRDDVLPQALLLAERIARNAPLALAASRRMIRKATGRGSSWDDDVWQQQAAEFQQLLASRDVAEGAAAFAEKRAPAGRAPSPAATSEGPSAAGASLQPIRDPRILWIVRPCGPAARAPSASDTRSTRRSATRTS